MASEKKTITKTFSRVKNHLAELQRWWPTHIKNDGRHGISVDPVLWRSDFSSDPTIDDEASVAGIRVEAIADDGTDVTGTEPTIVISGSGTFDPRCTINHADGTSTIIHLIAPTSERPSSGTDLNYDATTGAGLTQNADATYPRQRDATQYNGERRGPYPVFMTVQELADILDTWRHVGESDANKPAWLPHGISGDDLSETAPNPNIASDPRSSSDALPTTSPYRATVFMPMMLDNNQFSDEITGATTLFGGSGSDSVTRPIPAGTWNLNGITRYDSDPEGDDSSTVKWKKVGDSGDHLRQVNGTTNAYYKEVHLSQDSSCSPSPHYRMAMALACFLKDGTYSLNDGVLIPYVFDASRTLGGMTTDTLYMTWDGADGFGVEADEDKNTPAGVYPFFDFVQGPLTPRSQGTNWSRMVFESRTPASDHVGPQEVAPSTKAYDVYAVEVVKGTGNSDDCEIILYTEDMRPAVGSGGDLAVGDAIHLENISGAWGTGNTMTSANGLWWSSRYDKRSTTSAKDANGWWLVGLTSRVTADIETTIPGIGASGWGLSGSKTVQKIHIRVPLFSITATSQYITDDSATPKLRRGRMSGPELAFGNGNVLTSSGDTGADLVDTGGATGTPAIGAVTASSIVPTPQGRYGWEAGSVTGDCNVPVTASSNDTFPGRPTIGEAAIATADGEFVGDRPVPRSIRVETLDVAMTPNIPSAPTRATRGDGTIRVPAPLGHDLCARYNCITGTGKSKDPALNDVVNGVGARWVVRSDIAIESYDSLDQVFYHDRWAFRGLSTPLWSYVDSQTGRHAWDYIKPTDVGGGGTWTYGRNRPWPAHERMGTRLSMSPGLLASDSGWASASGNLVAPATATTKIGLSEIGCSPIHLDMEMTAFIPNRANRMTIIEFDGGETDPEYGRHHMLTTHDYRDEGFGFIPLWDGSSGPGVYRKGTPITVSGDEVTELAPTSGSLSTGTGIVTEFAGALEHGAAAGNNPSFASFPVGQSLDSTVARSVSLSTTPSAPFPATSTNNRPAVWMLGSAPHFTSTDWNNTEGLTLPGAGGFGLMGTGFGNGPAFSFAEGTNQLRTTFTAGGMTLTFNGTEVGTDTQASNPVWAMQVKSCNAFSMADRRPFFISGTKVFDAYSHLKDEEHLVVGVDRGGTDFPASRIAYDRAFFFRPLTATIGGAGSDSLEEYYPLLMPVDPSTLLDSAGRMTRHDNPALQTSNVDLQIDEVVMRQVPTPAMLPFTVDTVKQVVTGATVARYTSLSIEADNISTTKGMRVTVTLLEPPTVATIDQEASTVISGYEDLDPEFIGGVGAIDLTGLPTSVITNGFVIRFNFYVPSTEETDLHPVDWSKTPIVRSWTLYYDHKPTSDLAVIGNTYDGSLADTDAADYAFNAKVGHIVSVRVSGDTTDPDRKISFVKVDFGDGTITDWLAVPVPAANITYDLSHVYSERPSGGTYTLKAYVRDDSENESAASTNITATIVAAEPVAVLRAVPSMVRAGQAIRFDGSDSYAIDTGATLSTFTFGFGDGSTSVSGSALYQDHTYAQAGEFMATLTVNDGTSDSPTAKAVVKVLPATLVVPLTLSTKPSAFRRNRTSALSATPILDAVYPEVTDTGQRSDTFTLTGMFLKETMASDLAFMEELLLSGALVEFEYQAVNFEGVADSKVFVGRMTSFDYDRQGGQRDRTPYTATFIREAGLGA